MEATQADQPVVNTPVDVEDLLVRAAATRPRPALARALRLGLVGLDAVAVAGAMAGAMAGSATIPGCRQQRRRCFTVSCPRPYRPAGPWGPTGFVRAIGK